MICKAGGPEARSAPEIGQLSRLVVPAQGRHRIGAMFIFVGCAVIGEERELRVGTRIDANALDDLILARTSHGRSDRDDRAGAHDNRLRLEPAGRKDEGRVDFVAPRSATCLVVDRRPLDPAERLLGRFAGGRLAALVGHAGVMARESKPAG